MMSSAASSNTWRTYARVLLGVLSGALLIATLFLPWSARGVGSTIPGRRLADLLLREDPRTTAEMLGGTALYVVALVGTFLVAISAIPGRTAFVARVSLIGSTAVAAVIAAVWSAWTPSRWGGASLSLTAGIVAGFAALATGSR